MIRQYLLNINESATLFFFFKKMEVNKTCGFVALASRGCAVSGKNARFNARF